MGHSVPAAGAAGGICRSPNCPAPAGGSPAVPQGLESPGRLPSCVPSRSQQSCLDSKSPCGGGLNNLIAARRAPMADQSVFSTAGRTSSAQMDADLSTLHAPEAAAEVVDEGSRRVRERGQIDIVRSAICVDTATIAWQFVEWPIDGVWFDESQIS